MQTLKEAMHERNITAGRLQIYKELKTFLEQFVGRDGIPTTNFIQIENSRDIVTEDLIEAVLLEMNDKIEQLELNIQNLDNLKVR